MLNTVKEMIKKQNAYMEAADFIFEDGSNRNLDDEIILGNHPYTEAEEDMEDFNDTPEPEEVEEEETQEDDKETSLEDEPIDDENGPEQIEPEDVAEEPMDEEEPDMGGDPSMAPSSPVPGLDLPDGIGNFSDSDMIDVNLDLQSHTLRDILPIPPAGAAEAIDDDSMVTRVDAGFGGEEPEPPMEEPAAPTPDLADTPIEDEGTPSLDEESIEPEVPAGPPSDDLSEEPIGEEGSDDLVTEAKWDPNDFEKRGKRGTKSMSKISGKMDAVNFPIDPLAGNDLDIASSKGDLNQLKDYEDILRAFEMVRKLNSKETSDFATILRNLEKFSYQYRMGYQNNVEQVIKEYENGVKFLLIGLALCFNRDKTKQQAARSGGKMVVHRDYKKPMGDTLKSVKALAKELERPDHEDYLNSLIGIIDKDADPRKVKADRKAAKKAGKGKYTTENADFSMFEGFDESDDFFEGFDDDDDDELFTEEINLNGGGNNQNQDQNQNNQNQNQDQNQGTSGDPVVAAGQALDSLDSGTQQQDGGNDGEENAVTSAVRDQVSDAGGGSGGVDEFNMDDITGSGDSGSKASPQELMKKLGNLTKNLEDIKRDVVDSMV